MLMILVSGTNPLSLSSLFTRPSSLVSTLGMINDFVDEFYEIKDFRLTFATASSTSEETVLVDMNGNKETMTGEFVAKVLIVGWVSWALAIAFNIIYYLVHPMAPKKKMKTYILGYLWDLKECTCNSNKTKDGKIVGNQNSSKKEVDEEERLEMLSI